MDLKIVNQLKLEAKITKKWGKYHEEKMYRIIEKHCK